LPFAKHSLRLVEPRLALEQVGQVGLGFGNGRSHAVRCCCGSLLTANDDVVGPLVEDGVAALGAHDEVLGRIWVQINLGQATALDREAADVVVYHSVEGAAIQTDSIVSVRPRDAVIPHRGALGVVDADAFSIQTCLYFSGVVPDRRLNIGASDVVDEPNAVGIVPGPNKLVVMNRIAGWAARYNRRRPRIPNSHAPVGRVHRNGCADRSWNRHGPLDRAPVWIRR